MAAERMAWGVILSPFHRDVPVALFQSVPVPVGMILANTGTSIFFFNKWPLKPLTKQTGGKTVLQI